MKYLEPFNRHLWVTIVEEKEEKKQSAVLMPENYKPKESEFSIVQIKDFASDCNHQWPRGKKAVVEKSMIRKIELGDKIFHVILENYVLGIVK